MTRSWQDSRTRERGCQIGGRRVPEQGRSPGQACIASQPQPQPRGGAAPNLQSRICNLKCLLMGGDVKWKGRGIRNEGLGIWARDGPEAVSGQDGLALGLAWCLRLES